MVKIGRFFSSVAVSRLPNFAADPNPTPNGVHHPHKCTIHLNCESISELEKSFQDCQAFNKPSERPMIELVIPSSLDSTLAPEGAHVCLLFTQFTPYSPSNGSWEDPNFKEKYAQSVFNVVEEYAPGFKESIVGK
ncbi:unnamed protein product [Orchesella dallaii]|uniref:Uncharacterized protein n=1 Tax=Orchesella dallaii TaxID=48710 RepID=A0ABP1RFA8_9HEXA